MSAAARLGISHAEFMGWPHDQRDLMIALGRVERNTGQYGEWLPDATSERADPNYYGDDRIVYRPDGPYTNQAAKAVEDARDKYRKDSGENPNLNGMFWGVTEG